MNIRVPGKLRLTTRRDAEASKLSGEWTSRCNGVDWGGRQIRLLKVKTGCRAQDLFPAKSLGAGRQEKLRVEVACLTVPQTDTGRRGEKPKVLE